jgi:predicted Rossmann-fold nucleotide-binding protein
MGGARNVINVLSSDIIVAMAGKAGTISEIALALKYEKPVILLNFDVRTLFQMCSGEDLLHWVHSAEEAIGIIKVLLARREYTSHETSLPEKLENMQPEA